MSEKDAEPLFPRVTKDDVIAAELEDMLDPEDLSTLEWLRTSNPLLLGEIKRHAYVSAHRANSGPSAELLALLIGNALFPIRALRAAVLRQRQEEAEQAPGLKETTTELPNDGAGDVDPQPSA